MHELSIAMSIIKEAESVLTRQNAIRVTAITLSLGELSGIEEEPLTFSFPLAAEGTRAESAKLICNKISAKVMCEACGQRNQINFPSLLCPACSSPKTKLVEGREILISSMELEYDV